MKLMTHIVAGYPNIQESEKLILAMQKAGASYIEIQIPFSDPIADGPTIMKAGEISLKNGMTTRKAFQMLGRLKSKVKVSLLIMTYFNIAFNYGLEKFCKDAKQAGVYGLIIPDIPIDEEKCENYIGLCKKYGLHPIQVISPITPERRLKAISKVASGFIYCISTYGTTGERKGLDHGLEKYLKRVKRQIKLPLAVGFGISSKEQAKLVAEKADIVVIGSKVINLYNATKKEKIKTIQEFLRGVINCC